MLRVGISKVRVVHLRQKCYIINTIIAYQLGINIYILKITWTLDI